MEDYREVPGDLSYPKETLPPEQVALYGSIIIGLGRVYDVLLMMYSKMDYDGAMQLRKLHTEGKMFYPPPSYDPDE